MDIRQYWHPAPDENLQISFTAFNENNDSLSVEKGKGWYSPKYSVREESDMFIFSTDTKRIQTIIEVKPFKI